MGHATILYWAKERTAAIVKWHTYFTCLAVFGLRLAHAAGVASDGPSTQEMPVDWSCRGRLNFEPHACAHQTGAVQLQSEWSSPGI